MIPTPSLQALRILDASTRNRSYSAAAAELGLTHGAVSRQIASLENWTGEKLFARSGREMVPTKAALRLVAKTRTALEILGDAFGHPVVRKTTSGLSLSTTQAIARFWLIPRLADIPDKLISVVQTSQNLEGSNRDSPDIRLRYGPGDWSGVQSLFLGKERLVPVGAPHWAAKLRSGTPLHDIPLLGSPFQTWLPWFETVSAPPPEDIRIAYELPDMGLLLDAAVAGLGAALAPTRLIDPLIDEGKLVCLADREIDDVYGYYLVWNAASEKREQIEAFGAWAEKEFSAGSGGRKK